MENQNQNNIDPTEVELKPKSYPDNHIDYFAPKVLWGIIVFLLLIVIAGSVYWWQEVKKEQEASKQPAANSNQETQTSTSDWKTYINTEYGFEFQYPNDWSIVQADGKASYEITAVASKEKLSNPNYGSEGVGPDIIFNHYSSISEEPENKSNNFNAKTIQEFIDRNILISENKKINFAGYEAYEMTRGGLGASYAIMINKNGQVYEILFTSKAYKSELNSVENQVLSTFKFTNLSSSYINTSGDWEPYKLPDWEIVSFKIPPNWSVSIKDHDKLDLNDGANKMQIYYLADYRIVKQNSHDYNAVVDDYIKSYFNVSSRSKNLIASDTTGKIEFATLLNGKYEYHKVFFVGNLMVDLYSDKQDDTYNKVLDSFSYGGY